MPPSGRDWSSLPDRSPAPRRFRPTTLKPVFGLYFLYVAIRFAAGFFGIGVP